ncbi:N-6 DNA Methylase [Salegentibacter echinorum]|uniref:site-specific DNA-methyltransferase (adenine-specific) n=1 Tax=Salegentibacter echinorum TaxID=1073325 RepID=A0A1M5E8F8_SALEC|nr:type ISP restriction/modification enzyme [Salegentibacter echinorum]SHF75341.1 N-6 DNA Methylase [Salegentibacter echinorum]
MTIHNYLEIVNSRYTSGISREHSYRGDFENLLRSILIDIDVTNEPANVTDCGNPDYVLTNGKIPIGYIEAKDVGKDLNSKTYKEQFTRYRNALDNLIITDYLWFQFFQNGELVHEIEIAEIENGKIIPLPENFQQFENLIRNFCSFIGQTIKSAKKLAEMMAAKARLLQNILENAITSDEKTQENTSLQGQFKTFKEILIHDLTPKGFADIYAQTLAYGMFAARLHDPTLQDFSRQEAAELIPKSNPFLRKLFGYVAGPDIDERIKPTVDNLAEVFRATNVEQLLKNFGKSTQTQDAIIHFYETFLAEYDPKLRKARGVWYTPEPVVKFIVRAVDDVLKTEFNLPQGLADTSKTKIKVNTDVADKRSATGYKQTEKEVHKVQILDPATGTGTFLAEVVNYIYSKKFKAMQGAWSGYVEQHLIPRLNGFELLMASYAMAHLKLDMLLRETGYKENSGQRLNVYLTNSLEEHHKDTGTLFSNWLSTEANDANHIKRDTPVMCVIGNPPYSGESANKGKWVMDLMEDYKKEPGGKEKLKERNSKWINDDYVKFMRYGQHYIEKNGEGILAFINPHGFLDNPTFRGMRWNLLKTYDKIYTIDLHGNSKKKETAPDGGKDENVFDIQQGVSINILVKTGKKKPNELGEVYHYDCFGKRDKKYQFLNENNLAKIPFVELPNKAPNYFMVQKDFEAQEKFNEGFSINELFVNNSVGIVTARDKFTIHDNKNELKKTIEEFLNLDDEVARFKFNLGKDVRDWKIKYAKEDLISNYPDQSKLVQISYRPFDAKWTFYTGNSKGFHCYPRFEVMHHLIEENVGIIFSRQATAENWTSIQISKNMIDNRYHFSYKGIPQQAPLYLYPEPTDQQSTETKPERIPNLNKEILAEIEKSLGLEFLPEEPQEGEVCFAESSELRDDFKSYFTPLNLLDYIYAVLHSPTYRETYKEFLKIDFPRVPFPKDQQEFWQLVTLGGELRKIHLLESPKTEDFITTYPVDGDNIITRKITKTSPGFELNPNVSSSAVENQSAVERNFPPSGGLEGGLGGFGRVWINDTQYFDKVPKIAWEFYIGGYQPAQKWLKDRKGRELKFEDILHYQKIIVALTETDRLMKEIDKVEIV